MKQSNRESEQSSEKIRRDKIAEEIATARLLVLSPLLDTGLSRKQRARLRRNIAEKGWAHPIQGICKLSERTLLRWENKFQTRGLDGLRPRFRRDRGSRKAISREVFDRAKYLKQEVGAFAGSDEIRRSTLQRHLQRIGLTGRRVKDKDEPVGRYEAKMPGDVWHSDEKYGPWVWLSGKAVQVRIFGFIDDRSRFCPGIQAYLEGNEKRMQSCLRRAIRIWGCPGLLYADNGKVYISNQLKRICGELRIGLAHTPVRTPEANGKQERFWGTLAGFIVEANAAKFTSLDQLNEALWAWVELKYNRSSHSALNGQTPEAVYFAGMQGIRMAGEEELSTAFLHLARRRVHKDGTFSLNGKAWEAGPAWAGQEVEIRYDPLDDAEAWIYAEGRRMVKAQPFAPSARLPARKPVVHKQATGIGETSRAYLADLTERSRESKDPRGVSSPTEDPPVCFFTEADLLHGLDLAEGCLTSHDRKTIHAIFDTFGPIPLEPARRALEQAIAQWGNKRHLNVYLQIIVDATSSDSHEERHK